MDGWIKGWGVTQQWMEGAEGRLEKKERDGGDEGVDEEGGTETRMIGWRAVVKKKMDAK